MRMPRDLLEAVDELVNYAGFGYRSRHEFVIDAVRRRVDEAAQAIRDRGLQQMDFVDELDERIDA